MRHNGGALDEGIASIHDLAGTGDQEFANSLVFDTHTRISLLDHFLGPGVTPQGYAVNEYPESGDFLGGRYRVSQTGVSSNDALVKMGRTGKVDGVRLNLTKTIRLGKDARVIFEYAFECRDHKPISTLYGCEFNLTLYSDEDRERYYRIPEADRRREIKETGSEDKIKRFEMVNGPDRLCASFFFSNPVSVWFFPLMTISKSEKGFERTYQGSSLLFLHPMDMSPGEKSLFQFELELIEL
jgi:alpha-amylase